MTPVQVPQPILASSEKNQEKILFSSSIFVPPFLCLAQRDSRAERQATDIDPSGVGPSAAVDSPERKHIELVHPLKHVGILVTAASPIAVGLIN